jgi:PAS domain S-box-containing protein
MALARIGKLRRTTVVSLAALALTAGAFGVALTAAADSRSSYRELSGRLVPAAAAANDLLRMFAAQQATLRAAVTSGDANELATVHAQGAQLLRNEAAVSSLAGGDKSMTARADAMATAYRGWLASVADPQVTAMNRGEVGTARAIQADAGLARPSVLAVRTAGLALQSEITGEQDSVVDGLWHLYNIQLGALIAMIVVVAAIAVGIIMAVGRGLLRPVRELSKAVAAVADGGHGRRIPVVGAAELSDLSRDIELMRTGLVAAIDERERAQDSLRSLFDLAPDAMIGIAQDGTIMMANAQAVQLYGYTIGELTGRSVKTLLPKEWRENLAAVSADYLGDRRARPADREIKSAGLRRDGTTFPTEIRLSQLPTQHGTLVVAAVRDVTERLAMDAERERLRAAAEKERLQQRMQQSLRLESLGQLVGGVAHDFNNLLNVIAGYADFTAEQLAALAQEDDRIQPVLADVEQVRAAAQQAIRVTRQLLTFSRSDAAKPEVLDLEEVVESAGQLLGRSLGEQINLVIAAAPDLWRVVADRGQLEQVLVNVALNARDAMMPGGGCLTIEMANTEVDAAYATQRPGLEPGRYSRLAVSDTGAGMDAKTIERVFEPFFSTKERGRGTGLGLATVYGIVTGLGGTIDIYSEKGLGTTVNVLLPVTEQAAVAAAEPERPPQDLRGHGEAILLVEDEESLRTMATRILSRNGYQVRSAGSGAEAVRQAADPAIPVDLLVTDMVMPGMLGVEVVARVRAARPQLPALFISGYAQQVLDFHGIPAQDHDILQKPFTEAGLLSRVRQALNRARIPAQREPDSSDQREPGLDVGQQ